MLVLRSRASAAVHLVILAFCLSGSFGQPGEPSTPGGAGHALLFADHAVVLKHFKKFASDAFTFEAWLHTTDFCNRGAIMSYAKNAGGHNDPTPFNHFVIFDELNLLACHDYKYIDLWPDLNQESCASAYDHGITASYVERTPKWHHLAVTWTKDHGVTKIYKDGLLMAEAKTEKTAPLESDGAFMLGNEQDCYGGCTDDTQAFYGLMDEVRIWKTARSQEDILSDMRKSTGLENHSDLIAYWKFNDPDQDGGIHKDHLVAKDSSGNGNDLPLVTPPARQDVTIAQGGRSFSSSSVVFENNYALNPEVDGMPEKDLTVEFWAKTPAYDNNALGHNPLADLLVYATHIPEAESFWGPGYSDSVFVDDAIRIEKYFQELKGSADINHLDISTNGSLSIHINGNTDGNGNRFERWLDYAVGWTDDKWHHIAVSWKWETGETHLYYDGQAQTAFWRAEGDDVSAVDPAKGGPSNRIGSRSARSSKGSLVLGQDQECYGGCFSPQRALSGELANVRIWDRVLDKSEIEGNMFTASPDNKDGLVVMYNFAQSDIKNIGSAAGEVGKQEVKPAHGNEKNALVLWGDAPRWEYSTAPLMGADGQPVERPNPGSGGHAMYFNDQQVLLLPDFKDFPSETLTVEFWMWSVDTCRDSVPISYATDTYEKGDNSFLIFNYRDWGISVMEDEGHVSDHFSGISANDGTWHHIAVTWQSSDGKAILYDNGRKVWAVTRGKGKKIPSGGTLVLGREQDCLGGCFDSMAGATGKVDTNSYREYGPQDFFGVMDEMRIWKTVRTQKQIIDGMKTALHRSGTGGSSFGGSSGVSVDDSDLVAYWKFDEGQGYVIKDATGHGHDLHATSIPHWQVVRWLAECGNGVVEGFEECDVGSTTGGNGCSKECKVEDGYECTKTSPSVCTHLAPGQTPAPRAPPPPPRTPGSPPVTPHGGGGGSASGDAESGKASGGSGGSGSGLSGWGIFGIVLGVVLVGAAGVGFVFRHAIADNVPQVGNLIDSVRARFGRRNDGFGGLDHLDPEENLDLSPEFLGATAPRHPQGPYRPLDNEGQ